MKPSDLFEPPEHHVAVTRPLLYLDSYFWFVTASLVDVVLACLLLKAGHVLINPTFAKVMQFAGWPGMIALKLLLVAVLVVMCEEVGRRRPVTGRRIVWLATAVTLVTSGVSLWGLVEGF